MTDEEVARWAPVVDTARLFGAFDGGEVVGSAGAYALEVTVPGGLVPAAGVTMVGLLPSHRRRGIFKRLIQELLLAARDHGELMAILWASEGGIYQQFGFGLATRNASIDIETSRGGFRDAGEGRVFARLIGLDDAIAALPAIYDAFRRRTPGMLARSAAWWTAYRLGDPPYERGGGGPLQCCVFTGEHGDCGYALYRTHAQYERRLHHDRLEVVEAVHTSAAVAQDVWRYLLSMDLVERVQAAFVPEDTPLTLMLSDPGRLRLTLSDGLWLRLIDVEAALSARFYTGSGSVVLDVVDTLCDWNAGCWRVDAEAARAAVNRCSASPDLRLAIDDLASVYLGGFTFMDLHRAGRVIEMTDGAVMRASCLFQRERAPWCPEVI